MQALKVNGRQRALTSMGISSHAIAPDGKPWGWMRATNLVQDWASTWQTVLTYQQKKVCMQSGRCSFVQTVSYMMSAHGLQRSSMQ